MGSNIDIPNRHVSVQELPLTKLPAFFYDFVDCLGAEQRAHGSPSAGADIYAIFCTPGVGLNTRYHAVAMMYGDSERLRDRASRFLSRNFKFDAQEFFSTPKGRQLLDCAQEITHFELFLVDRNWRPQIPPDWLDGELKENSNRILVSFLGQDDINRLASSHQEQLAGYFDTTIKRLEQEISTQIDLRTKLENEMAKAKRMETERRWKEEENARLKKKASWKKISRELNHTFGNALNTIEETSRALKDVADNLDIKLELEFAKSVDRKDYSEPNVRNMPELSSVDTPIEEYLHSLSENLFWITAKLFRGANRARPIVNEFKHYATTRAGVRLKNTPVNELMSLIQNVTIDEKVTFVPAVDADFGNSSLEMDDEKIHQVFTELIQNAKTIFEAYNQDGKVRIKIRVEKLNYASRRGKPYESILSDNHHEYLHIIVADNGPGIPEEDKNDIFAPFMTARPKHAQQGSGQGLDTCDQIIQGHNGRIIEDGIPEQGARFRIFIPIQEGMK